MTDLETEPGGSSATKDTQRVSAANPQAANARATVLPPPAALDGPTFSHSKTISLNKHHFPKLRDRL